MLSIVKFLFNVPNTLCHVRIATGLLCYYYFLSQPVLAINCYIASVTIDNLDGVAARYFNQCSKFGACYDMIIDRMSTIIFMINLAVLIPQQTFWFALLGALDYSSHWFQIYVSQLKGAKSHKAMVDHNIVVGIYYNHRWLRFLFSMGFEMFIIQLYISCFGPSSDIPAFSQQFIDFNTSLYWFSFPNFLGRQIVNFFQLITALAVISDHEQPKSKL